MNGKKRIAEQSRIWLWESFEELLQKREFSEITITAIAQNAELARKTFYNSFANKEELLNYHLNKILNQYFDELQLIPKNQRTKQTVLTTFFEFWWKYKDLLILLKKRNLFQGLINQWLVTAADRYNLFEVSWHINSQHSNAKETRYLMSFILGGLSNVLSTWFDNPSPDSPDVMISITKQIIDYQSALNCE